MKITLLAIGAMKAGDPYRALVEEYRKRLRWPVEIISREAKHGLEGVKRQEVEAELLLGAIPKGSYVTALDERGKAFTSKVFADKLAALQVQGVSQISFIIGGADGLTDEVRSRADLLLALGPQTWPHRLAQVMLLEQLYRAWTILEGHPYHRE